MLPIILVLQDKVRTIPNSMKAPERHLRRLTAQHTKSWCSHWLLAREQLEEEASGKRKAENIKKASYVCLLSCVPCVFEMYTSMCASMCLFLSGLCFACAPLLYVCRHAIRNAPYHHYTLEHDMYDLCFLLLWEVLWNYEWNSVFWVRWPMQACLITQTSLYLHNPTIQHTASTQSTAQQV